MTLAIHGPVSTTPQESSPSRARRGRVVALSIVGGLVLIGAVGWMAMDEIVRRQAETKLESVYGVTATVDGASFHPVQRRIVLHGVHLNPELSEVPEDMVDIETVDILVYGRMIHSRATGSEGSRAHIKLVRPHFHLVVHGDAEKSQAGLSPEAIEDLQELSPWEPDEIHIEDGSARFIDSGRRLDIDVTALHASVTNIAAARNRAGALTDDPDPAKIEFDAKLEEVATLKFKASSQLHDATPDFEFDGSLMGFPLESVEPMIYEDKKIRIDDGYVALDVHLRGRDGVLDGWIAPDFDNVDFAGQLRDGFAAPLNAFGAKAKSEVLANPMNPGRSNKIIVDGSYGEGRPPRVRATKKKNSLTQRMIFNSGAQRLQG